MPNYRRNHLPGGTFFFTVNLADRSSHLLVEQIGVLRESVRQAMQLMPFHIDAWVVLPNHLHAVWTLPDGDADFPKRWHVIKTRFSASLPGFGHSPTRRGNRGIWQRGYWEHTIRDERDYAAHVDYVHFNPIKHGYVSDPTAWPYSSYRQR